MSLANDFMERVEQVMDEETQKLETTLADELDTRGITNQGTLRQSLESRTARSGTRVESEITSLEYGLAVADGTSGYDAPPPAPRIRRWVETKLNIPPALVREVTFLIRSKIFEEGTPTSGSPLQGRNDFLKAGLRRRIPEYIRSLEATLE